MEDVVITSGVRTAIGKFQGSFADVPASDLGAHVIREAVARAKIDPNVPDFKKITFIKYDYAKYGASAERRRLIAKWEKDVNSLPR